MAESGFNAALARKLQLSSAGPGRNVLRPADLGGALLRALRQAGAPYDGLNVEVDPQEPDWDVGLVEAKAALPERRLMAVLEGPGDIRALCVLESGVVDALVEVQTTGKVDASPALLRETTQIDAALTRDFIGLFLSGFAAEMTGQPGVNWPLGLTYGTYLTDERQLDLLFPDRPYHLIRASLTLGSGAKTGRVMLWVPVTQDAVLLVDDGRGDRLAWARIWPAIAAEAPVALEAVLMRQTMPLARLQALEVGDMLEFDRADLIDMRVSDVTGKPILCARLGCKSGKRAICLMPGAGLPPARKPPPPPVSDPVEKTPVEAMIDAAMPGPA
jgi:flagellar motor switch protein FliM